MPRNMPGKTVSRPAQGDNKGLREDPKWAPAPQPAPTKVSTGSVSKPKSPTAKARFKPQAGPGRVNNPGPAT